MVITVVPGFMLYDLGVAPLAAVPVIHPQMESWKENGTQPATHAAKPTDLASS